jgi:Leucine-rich repeat (LRR) protein
MPHRLRAYLPLPALLLLAACESYNFTVNEKLIYSPAPLFSQFKAPDTALQQCLEQAVIDGKVTSARELSTLNCSHAGVTNLDGLEVFTGIAKLKLSANNIRDISPIAALTILELLQLDNNGVIDTTPLLELPALLELDLAGNPELLCPADTSLMTLETLSLPEHCQQ